MALPASSPSDESLTIYDVASEEIRVLLARRRMPARALAPIIGKSQQMVSQRMTGMSKWTLEDLQAIAVYFGVDANTLLPALGGGCVSLEGVLPHRDQAAAGGVLPHLDSNQEPAGMRFPQVRARFLSVVRDWRPSAELDVGEESPTVTPRERLPRAV